MEAPAAPPDDVGEGHGQVRLALGTLRLVLLEDDRVELGAAVVEGVVALPEPGDAFARRQREGSAHAQQPFAVVEHLDAAGHEARLRVGGDKVVGCAAPCGDAHVEPARALAGR